MDNWLKQLKEGDWVSVRKPFGHPPVKGKVTRTTTTQVIVACRPWLNQLSERRFRKSDGCEIPYKRDGLRLDQPKETP